MEVNKMVTTGNQGEGVRSDCHVQLELHDSGGLEIEIKSKVGALFGHQIRELVLSVANYFAVEHATVLLHDSGALDFVMAARLEAAFRESTGKDKEYLSGFISENSYHTAADRNRFSRLYLPGNTPRLMINAGIHKPDGIILDLEDAVAYDKKFEARFLVRNALRSLDFYGAERMVRINQVPAGLDDLPYIVPHNVNLILVPKCESNQQIRDVNTEIERLKAIHNIEHPVWLMPIIESALGVVNAFEIATSAENVVAMAIGLEDYTADIGTRRTKAGIESFYARSAVVNACKAAGIQAIDSVFSDISDMEALAETVKTSSSLGFDGMGCIHPRQIGVIHEYFAPDDEEILRAKKIINAFDKAEKQGLGVVSLGTKMIDPPVVKRAMNTIKLAEKFGKLSLNWKDEHGE